MTKLSLVCLSMLFCGLSSYGLAEDKQSNQSASTAQVITIETATIRGNQELPNVLYLVPWQAPKINSLNATQTADLTENTIEHIDRNSFKRLIEYHESFKDR